MWWLAIVISLVGGYILYRRIVRALKELDDYGEDHLGI